MHKKKREKALMPFPALFNTYIKLHYDYGVLIPSLIEPAESTENIFSPLP